MTLEELKTQFKDIDIRENENMASHCSFRAGGDARYFALIRSVDELKAVLRFVTDNSIAHVILGNGTNVLFRDGLYEGMVIALDEDCNAFNFTSTNVEGKDYPFDFEEGEKVEVTVGAAMLISTFARLIIGEPEVATGMEALSGIPGSVGGAAFMNAGAYGSEMKDVVKCVHGISPDGREERDFSLAELDYGYRHSIFMENGYVVTSVTFLLRKGNKTEIIEKMRDFAQRRITRQPLKYPSAGSAFKRPEGKFAGKLIEDSNLKGISVGGAQVSELHAGFIINTGDATATDILQLISLVQNTVFDKFGVMLEPEVRII